MVKHLLWRLSARWLATPLVFALLTAQLLGLMHLIMHAPQAGRHANGVAHQPSLPVSVHRHVHASQGHDHDHGDEDPAADGRSGGKLAALFDGHDSDGDCRLFDQASHGHGAVMIATVFLPMALRTAISGLALGDARARRAAFFDARGPPLLAKPFQAA